MREISRKSDLSLVKDGWGYSILLCGEFYSRIWADSDETANSKFAIIAEREGY